MSKHRKPNRSGSQSWDPVADWYAGWVGPHGSEHHRRVAIPTVLELLACGSGEHVLDVGCGPGVLAPHIVRAGARYTGVDASARLVDFARRHHGARGRFIEGDVTAQALLDELGRNTFHAAIFLLSIQDIDPLHDAVQVAAGALRQGGRLAILMTHPCFRIPRQSGWGWDGGRKLRYRRIDRYLTPLAVPMKRYGKGRGGATRSYHRPLEHYVEALREAGLLVERIREVGYGGREKGRSRAERRANREIPLFLGVRAVKR